MCDRPQVQEQEQHFSYPTFYPTFYPMILMWRCQTLPRIEKLQGLPAQCILSQCRIESTRSFYYLNLIATCRRLTRASRQDSGSSRYSGQSNMLYYSVPHY